VDIAKGKAINQECVILKKSSELVYKMFIPEPTALRAVPGVSPGRGY
jgi:hypothetical protein